MVDVDTSLSVIGIRGAVEIVCTSRNCGAHLLGTISFLLMCFRVIHEKIVCTQWFVESVYWVSIAFTGAIFVVHIL